MVRTNLLYLGEAEHIHIELAQSDDVPREDVDVGQRRVPFGNPSCRFPGTFAEGRLLDELAGQMIAR